MIVAVLQSGITNNFNASLLRGAFKTILNKPSVLILYVSMIFIFRQRNWYKFWINTMQHVLQIIKALRNLVQSDWLIMREMWLHDSVNNCHGLLLCTQELVFTLSLELFSWTSETWKVDISSAKSSVFQHLSAKKELIRVFYACFAWWCNNGLMMPSTLIIIIANNTLFKCICI